MLCKCDYYRGLSVIKPWTINASGSLDSFSSLQHEHANGNASIHKWIYIFVICIYHCIVIVLSPLMSTMGLEKSPVTAAYHTLRRFTTCLWSHGLKVSVAPPRRSSVLLFPVSASSMSALSYVHRSIQAPCWQTKNTLVEKKKKKIYVFIPKWHRTTAVEKSRSQMSSLWWPQVNSWRSL